jgi:hypothetical protein
MKKLRFFIFIVIAIVLTSCASSDNGRYTKSEQVTNQLEEKVQKPWKEIKSEGSDFALTNTNSNSFFLFNSSCRKFEASTLNTLTASILTGLDNLEILERTSAIHQDREAVLVTAKGKLDGITRFFKILTTQKNSCIYDYVLIATNQKNLDTDTADFNSFTQSIKLN